MSGKSAYSTGAIRVELCNCAGLIAVPRDANPAPYVEAHNHSFHHRQWRALRTEPRFEVQVIPIARRVPTHTRTVSIR